VGNTATFDKLSGPISTRIATYCGSPTVFVNGQPIHFAAVLFRNDHLEKRRSTYGPPSLSSIRPEIVMLYANVEVGSDRHISSIQAWMERAFSQHPQALGACHLGLQPSMKWTEAHVGEMTLYDRPVDWSKAKLREASWASRTWRRDAARFLKRLVAHLHTAFSGRIILYQVGAGSCAENVPVLNPYTGHYIGPWFCGDFSEPMLAYFRRKLRHYYRNDLARLRRAWGDPNVTFESAQPPDRAERMRTEWFAFRCPLRSRTADYYRAWSEAVEDCVLAWCKAIKDATGGQCLTASPIGSILDCGLNANLIHHLMKNTFHRALASPYLDMLQSPASYAMRDPGRGDTSSMIPLGALRLAGKIWLRDLDTRTSVVANKSGPVEALWRTPSTCWEDVQVLKRDAAYSLLKGGAFWWHEIVEGMYRLRGHVRIARRIQAVARGVVHADRSTPPGLAVFVDNDSNFHQANSNRLIFAMNYEARQLHWAHAGLACEIYHINDASNPRMPAHKLIMVTNAFFITDRQARAIIQLARRNSATIIWLVAPAVGTRDGFDVQRTSRITGFNIKAACIEAVPSVTLVPSRHPWSRPALAGGGTLRHFGSGPLGYDDSGARAVGPLFYVDTSHDSDVVVLGVSDVLGEPALVVRRMAGYTSLYCAAPYVHNALLRAIGADCGAHVYLEEDDLVHAAGDLLLVHAKRAGRKQIRWPRRVETVFDLYTGRDVAADCSRWPLRMRRHETRFLFAGARTVARKVLTAMGGRLVNRGPIPCRTRAR